MGAGGKATQGGAGAGWRGSERAEWCAGRRGMAAHLVRGAGLQTAATRSARDDVGDTHASGGDTEEGSEVAHEVVRVEELLGGDLDAEGEDHLVYRVDLDTRDPAADHDVDLGEQRGVRRWWWRGA